MLPFNSHCSGCHRCPAIEQDVWDEGEGRKGNGAERVDGETAREGRKGAMLSGDGRERNGDAHWLRDGLKFHQAIWDRMWDLF